MENNTDKNSSNNQSDKSLFQTVRRITAMVMIISAILFALIGIMATWEVFGEASDAIWRSLASLAILAFASLIANIAARTFGSK